LNDWNINYVYLNNRHDELVHIVAAMSELLEYFNTITTRSSHLIYYDSKQHHTYRSQVEGQSIFPVATDIPPEVQMINTIFHSWTDWIIEAEVVPFEGGDEGNNCHLRYIIQL